MAYRGSIRDTMKAAIFWFVLLAFLVVVIPLYALGIGQIEWGRNEVRRETEKSMYSEGAYYADILDRELQSINRSRENVLTSLNMRRLGIMAQNINDWDRITAILYLQERFATIKESSEYIEDITAYIPAIGLSVSAQRGVDRMDAASYRKVLADYTAGERDFLFFLGGTPYMASGFPLVQYRVKHWNEPPRDASYFLLIKLSKANIERMLHRLASTEEGSAFLVHEEQGIVISSGSARDRSVYESLQSGFDADQGIFTRRVDGGAVIGMYRKLQTPGLSLCYYAPQDAVYRQVNAYRTWLIVFILSSVAIIAVFSSLIYTRVHVPLRMLVKAFGRMAGGDMQVRIKHRQNDEFKYLYTRFNDMAQRLGDLIEQDYKQRILVQQAQLKQLQSRINPHFLFNSFFTLSTMARTGDNDGVAEFSDYLGDYFRFITRLDSDTDLLGEEIRHAGIFARIQTTRFSNKIMMTFGELPPEAAGIRVPRLIVQPLLENCFEYGFNHVVSGGTIDVSFVRTDGSLHIVVQDNGVGMQDSDWARLQDAFNREDVEATGLVNIHRRVLLYFGSGGIRMDRRPEGGMKVELIIPWKGGAG